MSKKNKIQKQLLRAQIEKNTQALASGKSLEQNAPVVSTSNSTVSNNSAVNVMPKDITEFTLIRKDILFSIFLILVVIVAFLVIYLLDNNLHFLLPLANKIFSILQK